MSSSQERPASSLLASLRSVCARRTQPLDEISTGYGDTHTRQNGHRSDGRLDRRRGARRHIAAGFRKIGEYSTLEAAARPGR